MKCAREHCPNETVTGWKYCSRACAPYGHLCGGTTSVARRNSLYEKKTVASTTPGAGGPSRRSFAVDKPTDNASVKRAQAEERNRRQSPGQSDQSNLKLVKTESPLKERESTVNTTERHGTSGIAETRRESTQSFLPDENQETLPAESTALQTDLETVRSRSLSLVHSSTRLLHDCLKQRAGWLAQQERISFQEVNALANLGKQIGQLAKVQLDAFKASLK